MAASTDTIQILLRQRQELRQALLDLREEIETLNASSLDLVNKNVKSQKAPLVENTRSLEAASSGQSDLPDSTTEKPTNDSTEPSPELTPSGEKALKKPTAQEVSEQEKRSTVILPQPGDRSEPKLSNAATGSVKNKYDFLPKSSPKPPEEEAPVHENSAIDQSNDPSRLLANAKSLSAFFLEHPSVVPSAQLASLDVAISNYETAAPDASLKFYHSLQSTYRTVASQSYANQNINGTTLIDSKNGARLLWIIPLCIAALVLVVFPLLLFTRTMANEMFIADFATNLVWVFGASSAFLWGIAGALTLLTLTIALHVRRREYDANIRYSSALHGALGGIIGCCCYLVLENWVPASNGAAEFGLNLAAFAVGMTAGIIFAALQRVITIVVSIIEPDKK